MVVRVGVFALAPLHDRLVVADAHDRCPRALTGVIPHGRRAVVREAEVVAGLVRCGLGDVLGVVRAERLREHPCGLVAGVAGCDRVEDIDERDATATATTQGGPGRRARRDQHASAVHGVGGIRPVDRRRARVLGRDVDVERGVVLGNALPHALHDVLLRRAEGGRVAVGVERRVRLRGQAVTRVPRRAGDELAVEIEVQGATRPGLAVEKERL